MMTQRPKCSATTIMGPLKLITAHGVQSFIKITEPRTGALLIRASESAELRVAVCGTCGYAEHYIEEAPQLWKYWQEGYR